jgi:hypothetical protein
MSQRKPRGQKRVDRESLISQYMSDIQAMLLTYQDHTAWMNEGSEHQKTLKLVAERETFKLMRAREEAAQFVAEIREPVTAPLLFIAEPF